MLCAWSMSVHMYKFKLTDNVHQHQHARFFVLTSLRTASMFIILINIYSNIEQLANNKLSWS